MLLSQAIAEGLKLYPRTTHNYIDIDDGKITACCAMGGVALVCNPDAVKAIINEATDFNIDSYLTPLLNGLYPFLNENAPACPFCQFVPGGGKWSYLNLIAHMNDSCGGSGISREEIAEWVKGKGL